LISCVTLFGDVCKYLLIRGIGETATLRSGYGRIIVRKIVIGISIPIGVDSL
tara:strand:+ start:871 stop:1026 length:156 start_codon:yes stop_codon:yes gene_type:complete